MRTPIVAGNWKMFKTPAEAAAFAKALVPALAPLDKVEQVVCPPFIDIPGVSEALKGTPIKVGAQNVHYADGGAYTGEISPRMLKGLCQYVLVGQYERRIFFAVGRLGVRPLTQSLSRAVTPVPKVVYGCVSY